MIRSAWWVPPVNGQLFRKISPLRHVVEQLGQRTGRHVHRHDMDGQRILDGDQLVVVGQDGAGKVARVLDDGRAAGAHDDQRHLAHDRLETAFQYRHQKGVNAPFRSVEFRLAGGVYGGHCLIQSLG
ncbi:hypothetical protein BG36_15055 [Aquamicrobium defluvii]|uniref:Uncharacterized protein n=1 Tax=Aquamicrobium defluvii TaxID=69279 RepID=A0A011U9B7_9HYPH|nr:hypothetical protein BG36_15055 [Aquamicrobium defluvii]EZQ13142.1 hypothetical protein CF98_29630 [Halopseudomonas bauzanensis]